MDILFKFFEQFPLLRLPEAVGVTMVPHFIFSVFTVAVIGVYISSKNVYLKQKASLNPIQFQIGLFLGLVVYYVIGNILNEPWASLAAFHYKFAHEAAFLIAVVTVIDRISGGHVGLIPGSKPFFMSFMLYLLLLVLGFYWIFILPLWFIALKRKNRTNQQRQL